MMLALLLACTTDLNAPPEIAYDHVACGHCGMLVGDPDHAAALVTRDGKTRAFDDPGCLLRFVIDEKPAVAHLWFHHANHWYTETDVGFLTNGQTPMGSGLVAVPAGTPGSIGVGEASGRVLR